MPELAPADITVDSGSRPQRSCAGCGQTDDHPRHVTSALVGDEAPEPWHHDCHAAVGCRICQQIVRDAGGVTGQKMLDHKVALIDTDAQEG